jgi:glycosyltransferase involved in cell wall biosynthesis
MSSPQISVCIPVYNCEKFINKSIDSILNQDFSDFELIIIDNRSTDNTVAVIKEYKDPRIKFFQNETNIGMLANWNKVLTLATAEYIKILPADDFMYPGTLRLQYEVFEKDKEKKISLVCGRKNIIDDNGKILFSRGYSKTATQDNGIKAINKTIRSGGNIIGEPGVVMFRREILERTGAFNADIYYVMDLDMWFKMLLFGDLYSLPNIVTAFRISTASESTRIIDSQRKDVDNFIEKIYSDKRFGVSTKNYKLGKFNSFLSTIAKKIIYKYVLK